jgi:SAM-dependent methyltransferase
MSSAIFDRRVRRRHAERAAPTLAKHDFLRHALADDLADRLTGIARKFERVLDLGGTMGDRIAAPLLVRCGLVAATGLSVVGDEDRLPFADASFDLIVSAGVLQGVGDLPGALLLARRALVPDGQLIASFFGGATLGELRADLLAAESDLTGRAAARIAPMVDPREAAALLQRAGFALPVADVDTLVVKYDSLFALIADVHGTGDGNALADRVPLRRDVLADAARRFGERADAAGRVAVTVQVITLAGWAPMAGQPQLH